LFASDGSYDAETARLLHFQLASADLRTRVAARQLLVEHGSRSFKFVVDTLDAKTLPAGADRATLVDSLAKSVDEIELQGTSRFPAAGHLKLAVGLYHADNFKAAAEHFDRAQFAGAAATTPHLAMRAHSYLETGRYADAVRSFNEYLAADGVAVPDRAWARNNLGFAYGRLGRQDESAREYREALRLAPNDHLVQNNLAYLMAKRGERYPEALALVDRALRSDPNNPYYLETRGYVLYRLGRVDEGHALIKQSLAKIPDDPDSLNDLKEVEDAMRVRRRPAALPAAPARK
jgi:Flp pilus assembly protein TadD